MPEAGLGGRVLPFRFWRAFAEIENVAAIKMAPFNRYQTLDVMRAVAEARLAIAKHATEIALREGARFIRLWRTAGPKLDREIRRAMPAHHAVVA